MPSLYRRREEKRVTRPDWCASLTSKSRQAIRHIDLLGSPLRVKGRHGAERLSIAAGLGRQAEEQPRQGQPGIRRNFSSD